MNTSTLSASAAPPFVRDAGTRLGAVWRRMRPRRFAKPLLRRNAGLLHQAIAPSTLAAAWSRVRRNAGVAGGDGVSCVVFERDAEAQLTALRQAVRAGAYKPGPLRRVEIVKENGGTRPLAIPCVIDRVLQTAVSLVVTPIVEPAMSDTSFGYRPGLGVTDAVTRVIELRRRDNRGWVLEGDIARFFETVPHKPLLDLVDARVGDGHVTELVALWLDDAGDADRGLPQGSPLSPLLANIYLDQVDHLLDDSDARHVRYADDFVMLARRKADAEAARDRADELLRERGLVLHPEKTIVTSFEDGFWFLGHYFVRNLVLRDLEHSPDAAPPTWELDAPTQESTEIPIRVVPKRPRLAKLSATLRARLRRSTTP